MDHTLAYCGLQCDTYPIHLATLEKDKARQAEMRTTIDPAARERLEEIRKSPNH